MKQPLQTPAEVEREVVAAYERGLSSTEVARVCGVGRTTVDRIMRRTGRGLRTRSEALLLFNRKYPKQRRVFE